VVFDASQGSAGTPARQDYQGIRVLNALQQQADDLIEDLLERRLSPPSLTVVSDDRRLKDAARRCHCNVLGCWITSSRSSTTSDPAPPTPGGGQRQTRGNNP